MYVRYKICVNNIWMKTLKINTLTCHLSCSANSSDSPVMWFPCTWYVGEWMGLLITQASERHEESFIHFGKLYLFCMNFYAMLAMYAVSFPASYTAWRVSNLLFLLNPRYLVRYIHIIYWRLNTWFIHHVNVLTRYSWTKLCLKQKL